MQFRRKIALPLVVCSLGLVASLSGPQPAGAAVTGGAVLGLTTANVLVGFDAANPAVITNTLPISGLQPGETIVAIDRRPATSELYGVAVNNGVGRLYVILTSTGAATPVSAGPFSTTLPVGGTWSADFHPDTGRIRVVHSSGATYRVNAHDGVLFGTSAPVAPSKPTAVAFFQAVDSSAAISLFSIDDVADTLNRIGGVNNAPSWNLGVSTQIGPLGVDVASGSVGFDTSVQGDALASFNVGGLYGLYSINVATGAATGIGPIGNGLIELRDIALPRPPLESIVVLATPNRLLRFQSASPGTAVSTTITGMQPGENMVGIDVRPATGELYGVGLSGTTGRIYKINPETAVATAVSNVAFAVTAAAPTWAVDFNPTVDRIRFTNSLGDSYRLNPNTGELVATDTDIGPAKASALAYDRPLATSTATTLYLIDDVAETLNTLGGPDGVPSPNAGVTIPRGPLGVVTDDARIGFDISAYGYALAAMSVENVTGLYAIDLATGRAAPLGTIGNGSPDVLDLAVLPLIPAGASQFTPVPPTRLLDTRLGGGVKPVAGTTVDLQVTGIAGVPANATTIVLNTTGTESDLDGFVTVYPTGETRPIASNNNLTSGQTRANLVTVKIGAGGKVSLFTSGGVHLVADVFGYYAPITSTAGRFNALSPARLIDTRESTKVASLGSVTVPVLNRQGVPATGVSSVLVNIAATDSTQAGFITAYASGTPLPGTSNLNVGGVGSTVSNLAIVPVGSDGAITVFSSGGAHIVVDVAGWFSDSTGKGGFKGLFVPLSPVRVLDTRSGLGAPTGPLGINSGLDLTLAGTGGIPLEGASAALINVTSAGTTIPGFVTVYPTGQTRTAVSSLNVDIAGQITPNLAGATFGADGKVTLFSQPGGHLIADVAGWYTTGGIAATGTEG